MDPEGNQDEPDLRLDLALAASGCRASIEVPLRAGLTGTGPGAACCQGTAPAFDLRPGQPDPTTFPREAWLRSSRRVLATAPAEVYRRGDPCGRPELRAALADYLVRARQVLTSPDHIVITSGYSQALGLVARVLADQGAQAIAMEDPSHPFHREIVTRAGLRVIPLPVDVLGARTDLLGTPRFRGIAAVVVTPAHQYPTGATLHQDRRRTLTTWALTHGGLIIEDDYDGEFRYDRQPVGAVQGLAPGNVIYSGTASKTLSPALRLGWLAVPKRLMPALSDAKRHADTHTASLGQLVLADLIDSRAFDRHLKTARLRYRRRRDLLLHELAARAPQVQVSGVAAGLHALVKLPATGPAEAEIIERAANRGVMLRSLADHWHRPAEYQSRLIIGYSTPAEQAWPAALDALCELLSEAVTERSLARPGVTRAKVPAALPVRRTGSARSRALALRLSGGSGREILAGMTTGDCVALG